MSDWLPLLEGARPPRGLLQSALLPLLGLAGTGYGLLQQARATAFARGLLASHHPGVPVIAIGNLTVGGTGKTPTVLYLARHLMASGRTVAVVSRGYGADNPESLKRIADGHALLLSPPWAADEPFLIARSLPGVQVATCPDRRLAMAAVLEWGAEVILLDDAYQHLAARRDFNLLLLDARRPWGNGRLLPGGILREFPAAVARADHILLTRAEDEQAVAATRADLARLCPDMPVATSVHRPMGWRSWESDDVLPLDVLAGRKLLAFCGIAWPESFRATLAKTGARVEGVVPFPDHHPFSDAILMELVQQARACGAEALVCTGKDAVKIRKAPVFPLYVLEMALSLKEGEEALLARVGSVWSW